MTEAQKILNYIHSQGVTDATMAEHLNVSRSSITRIRSAKYKDYTGVSLLTELRKITLDGERLPKFASDRPQAFLPYGGGNGKKRRKRHAVPTRQVQPLQPRTTEPPEPYVPDPPLPYRNYSPSGTYYEPY